MMEGVRNIFKEIAEESNCFLSSVPHFFANVESCINSFDDADKSLNNVGEENTFVSPHEVDSYTRADGTVVEGYWRDGDGNTSINLTEEEGGGYFRNV